MHVVSFFWNENTLLNLFNGHPLRLFFLPADACGRTEIGEQCGSVASSQQAGAFFQKNVFK
jgi:hypothetical protein